MEISGSCGTITLDDIAGQLDTDQVEYDGHTFATIAHIRIMSGASGSLTISEKTMIMLQCFLSNDSGGTFTVDWEYSSIITDGRYGASDFDTGDSIENCAFRNGNRSGYISSGYMIANSKRMIFREIDSFANNYFVGNNFFFAAQGISGVEFDGLIIVEGNFVIAFVSNTPTYSVLNSDIGKNIYYDTPQNEANTVVFRNCIVGTTNNLDTGQHIKTYANGPNDHCNYYDCTFRYVDNSLPNVHWWRISASADGTYNTIDIYNSLALTVLDKNGNAVENANIDLRDKNGAVQASGTTDSDGEWSSGDVKTNILTCPTPGTTSTSTTYTIQGPFALTIQKSGYETYKQKFVFNQKTDWTLALRRSPHVGRDAMGAAWR